MTVEEHVARLERGWAWLEANRGARGWVEREETWLRWLAEYVAAANARR